MADNPISRSASAASENTILRAKIDAGHTGDKVAGSDPAAAPLGTDDEAAGVPRHATMRTGGEFVPPRAPGRPVRSAAQGRTLYLAGLAVIIVVAGAALIWGFVA